MCRKWVIYLLSINVNVNNACKRKTQSATLFTTLVRLVCIESFSSLTVWPRSTRFLATELRSPQTRWGLLVDFTLEVVRRLWFSRRRETRGCTSQD